MREKAHRAGGTERERRSLPFSSSTGFCPPRLGCFPLRTGTVLRTSHRESAKSLPLGRCSEERRNQSSCRYYVRRERSHLDGHLLLLDSSYLPHPNINSTIADDWNVSKQEGAALSVNSQVPSLYGGS